MTVTCHVTVMFSLLLFKLFPKPQIPKLPRQIKRHPLRGTPGIMLLLVFLQGIDVIEIDLPGITGL
ncbi:MAG TPA: hypothetical protein VGD14_19900 [bacterium]